jgi:hypothetical protein
VVCILLYLPMNKIKCLIPKNLLFNINFSFLKKAGFVFLPFFMALNFAFSQPINLVEDPGFERFYSYDSTFVDMSCEELGLFQFPAGIRNVVWPPHPPWFGASVDLMSACFNWLLWPPSPFPWLYGCPGFSTVPANYCGTQYPHNGNNYLLLQYGIFVGNLSTDTAGREYASSTIQLQDNKEYCAGFWANLGDSSSIYSYGPGIKFFNSNPGNNVFNRYFLEPDVWGDFFLDDSLRWKKVSGVYKATGNEQYFVVGNFWPPTAQYNLRQEFKPHSYPWSSIMFIDDVFITELGNISAGSNKDICLGDSVTLGSAEIPGADYTWYPSEGLSNIHAAQPKAAPNTTTTYHLIMDQCRILYDSVTVTVRNPNELAIFPKEISVCKGTSVAIAPINTYNNSGSTLAFIPANSFTKIYPDSAIFNAEQNTNIAVVQQFNGTCAQVQNNISIKTSTCKDSASCGGYVNENSILLTPFPTKELTIYSLAGSIVFYASNYNNDYNCSDLSSGIYLLKQTFADGSERVCKLGWVKR